ncbi:MAG: PGPGW domain-containing protein [Pseudomonadota bacterium]
MGPLTAGVLAFLHKLAGTALVVFGLALSVTPIPIGLVMVAVGLLLLAPYFKPIQRVVRSLRCRSCTVNRALLKIKRRCPPVIRSAIEKTAP